jgi:hypothetical protein
MKHASIIYNSEQHVFLLTNARAAEKKFHTKQVVLRYPLKVHNAETWSHNKQLL